MIKVIAMDELGQFEKRMSGIRFIGGYVFPTEAYETENLEIEAMLKAFCNNFNAKFMSRYPDARVFYPQSLHGSGNIFYKKNKNFQGKLEAAERKSELVQLERKFHSMIEEETVGFLNQKKAKLYMFLDPYIGEATEERDHLGTSNILDRSYGANFYERMATLALFNQTFFTIDEDCSEIAFELATKTLNESGDAWNELYCVYTNAREETKSTITNTSTYKTAVAAMLYSERVASQYLQAKYRFNVKSINYYSTSNTTPYLYLADIVCGYIRRKIQCEFRVDKDSTENRIDPAGLDSFCNRTGIEVRIYDKCDTMLRNMIQYAKEGELAKYYHLKYQLLSSSLRYRDFYAKHWLPKTDAYIRQLMAQSDYSTKVGERIPEFLGVTEGFMGSREVRYEAGLFIAEALTEIVSEMNEYRNRKLMLFRLYDVILRGYNHRGSILKTQECIAKCEEYKSAVGIEEYIAHTLRTLVFYFNAMKYEAALESGLMLEAPVAQLKKMYAVAYKKSSKISQNIIDEQNGVLNEQLPIAGKLYSSIGQAYAFLGQFGASKRYFLKALKEFEKNSPDYAITLSHFLQLLISNKKKTDYEVYSHIYFGDSNLWDQMERALSAKDGGFSLLLFVKAFRVFYATDRGNSNILAELVNRIQPSRNNEHPWELIYKNLYEAVLKQPKLFKTDDYRFLYDRAVGCIKDADATIKMIQIYTKLMYSSPKDNASLSTLLCGEEVAVCKLFVGDAEQISVRELQERLSKLLVYSYS